jgi:hypothetical protein
MMVMLQQNARGVLRRVARVFRRITKEGRGKKRIRYTPLTVRYQVVIPKGVSATKTSPAELKRLEERFKSLDRRELLIATVTHITAPDDEQFPDHFIGYIEGKQGMFILPRRLVSFQQGLTFSI